LGQGPTNGSPGGGTWGSNTWGLCRPGSSSAGAPAGTVGGHPLYWPLPPVPTPPNLIFASGEIIANGGSSGGAAGAGSGNGGMIGGVGGYGGYTRVTWNVRDVGAPAINTAISVTVGQGGGGGDRAYDSGAQGQYGSPGTAGKVVLTWS
jgi:hypothetical protein